MLDTITPTTNIEKLNDRVNTVQVAPRRGPGSWGTADLGDDSCVGGGLVDPVPVTRGGSVGPMTAELHPSRPGSPLTSRSEWSWPPELDAVGGAAGGDDDAGVGGLPAGGSVLSRAPYAAMRLPDGRVLAWAEYGNPSGVPCVMVPDGGSSRLAPGWMLHGGAPPEGVRLLALDRPGVGASDPVGLGGREQLAEDLRHLVRTLAVGRVAVIAIGSGLAEAAEFAARYPSLVVSIDAESTWYPSRRRGLRRTAAGAGVVTTWRAAAGRRSDLTCEATWTQITRNPAIAAVIGERWRDPAFRIAVAQDAAQSRPTHEPAPRGRCCWVASFSDVQVPVRYWHGQYKTVPAEHLVEFAEGRPHRIVTALPGSCAVLDHWDTILGAAASAWHLGTPTSFTSGQQSPALA